MNIFIAIDGGGTKTLSVACDEHGNILAFDKCGGSNPNDIGACKAVEVLCVSVNNLLMQLSSNGINIDKIYIFAGISGALNHKNELYLGLKSAFSSAVVKVESDAINILSSEDVGSDCCALICGTGSVCFARHGERVERIGGWGYLLDGGGSGYTIGRDVLSAALEAFDGQGEPTILCRLIEEYTGISVAENLSRFYSEGKPYIASFAKLVFDGAETGDSVCKRIIERNADYSARLLLTATKYYSGDFPALLGGGIFSNYKIFFDIVSQKAPKNAKIILISAPPVLGAFVEALKLADKTPDISVRNCFLKNFNKICY